MKSEILDLQNLEKASSYIELLAQLQIPMVLSCSGDFSSKEDILNYARSSQYIVDSASSVIKNLNVETKKQIGFGEPVTHMFLTTDMAYGRYKDLISYLESKLNLDILGNLALAGLHLIMFDEKGSLLQITHVCPTNWKPVFINIFEKNGIPSGHIPSFIDDDCELDLSVFQPTT